MGVYHVYIVQHFKATEGDAWKKLNLKLPITFCQAKQTRIRFPGDAVDGDSAIWEKLEQDWSAFWSPRGKEKLAKSGKAAVDGEHSTRLDDYEAIAYYYAV